MHTKMCVDVHGEVTYDDHLAQGIVDENGWKLLDYRIIEYEHSPKKIEEVMPKLLAFGKMLEKEAEEDPVFL